MSGLKPEQARYIGALKRRILQLLDGDDPLDGMAKIHVLTRKESVERLLSLASARDGAKGGAP